MKTSTPAGRLILSLLAVTASQHLLAQTAAPTPANNGILPAPIPYQVTAQDANSRLWQSTTYEQAPDGTIHPHLRQYTEISSGLNYLRNGQWTAAQEIIEPFAGGAVARQGQYQVIFANNINSEGSVDVQTADGQRLRSSILGLAYYDLATSNTVVFAQIQDAQGQLISPNQVLYTNSFTGVNADIRYTYRKAVFEQEVILRQQPPTPESLGLNSATTELEVYTEFISPPPASVTQLKSDEQTTAGLEPDHCISWGATTLSRGHAFDLGDNGEVPVSKHYVTIDGRHILIEKVRLQSILTSLANLPEQASLDRPRSLVASRKPSLPGPRTARKEGKPIKYARMARDKGFVLDYISLSSGYTNYTFQGDTTYYVSGSLNLSGLSTFEGGTVIKFASGASLTTVGSGGVLFATQPWLPVTLTAKDDNTCGQPISGSTGSPSGYYANPALYLPNQDISPLLSDLKIAFASAAINAPGTPLSLYDVQFYNCGTGLAANNATDTIENALMTNVRTNFALGVYAGVIAEHVTFNNAAALAYGLTLPTGTSLALTNCVLANVTNVSGTGAFNGLFQSPPLGIATVTNTVNPFQAVLGGACYLTNGCAFRNIGTNRIDPLLLAELSAKTTWSPLVYSNTAFHSATNFSPCVPRDTNAAPDLGYHYAPLDYVFGGANAYSNITFTAGTAVGWYNGGPSAGSSQGYGIGLNGTAQATFNGTATAPCIFAKNNMVQEGTTGYWNPEGYLGGFVGFGGHTTLATAPTINFHFTHCYSRQTETAFCRDYGDGTLLVTTANNSEFYSGQAAGYLMYFFFTNCLNSRTIFGPACSCSSLVTMRNCTFYGGELTADRESGTTWPVVVEDCAFAGVNFTYLNDTSGGNTNITWINYNSYLTTDTQPAGQGSHYLTVTNYNWQDSWLGDYYLPPGSPLLNAGSTPANLIGLYHFTTQTNQIPQGNAQVDIGYHYVATDQYGNPLDTNGNGIPDYLEDANGNGTFDAGDLSDWLPSAYHESAMDFSNGTTLLIFEPRPDSAIP